MIWFSFFWQPAISLYRFPVSNAGSVFPPRFISLSLNVEIQIWLKIYSCFYNYGILIWRDYSNVTWPSFLILSLLSIVVFSTVSIVGLYPSPSTANLRSDSKYILVSKIMAHKSEKRLFERCWYPSSFLFLHGQAFAETYFCFCPYSALSCLTPSVFIIWLTVYLAAFFPVWAWVCIRHGFGGTHYQLLCS